MQVFREFSFEAAHSLPAVPDGHKCARLHGHSYQVEIHITGPLDHEKGWVTDFADITSAFEPLRRQLDHHCLNDVPGLANPTCEYLACWIWDHLSAQLDLVQVTVREHAGAGCVYCGELPP
jgi:6-pyruvoyltetrahydropterin/6-carboxytetrahydropterin synthase